MTDLKLRAESNWRGVFAGSPDLGTTEHDFNEGVVYNFANGTGADQANQLWQDSETVAGSRSLDLAGGVTNALGATVTFTAIKGFRLRAGAANAANITVGGAGSNPFTGWFADSSDKIAVPPGGMIEFINPSAAGWTVTAGTGDILLIAGTNGDTYKIELFGEG